VKDSGLTTSYGQKDTVISAADTWYSAYVKFTGDPNASKVLVEVTGTALVTAIVDNARLVEITAAEYAKVDVDPEWIGDKLADKFPYIDSVQHTQGVAVRQVGRNLLPPTNQWTFAGSAGSTETNVITATATGAGTPQGYVTFPAIPNTQYTLSGVVSPYNININYDTLVYDGENGTGNIVADNGSASLSPATFTTPANAKSIMVRLIIGNSTPVGTITLTNPQLELGSVATPFQPYNADYIYLPTNLASNLDGSVRDTAYEREGVWYKYKKWSVGNVLDGSQAWVSYPPGTIPAGARRVTVSGILGSAIQTASNNRITKYDGTIHGTSGDINTTAETWTIAATVLHASVPNTLTGFSDAYVPTNQEWKNYFNGWKMNNGTLGTAYPGTGTKYWTALESPRADIIGKVAGSVVENPNKVFGGGQAALYTPSAQTDNIDQLRSLNGFTYANGTALTVGHIAQQMFSFNLIEHVLRKYGSAVFGAAVTTVDRVTWLKANIGKLTSNLYAYGSGPLGNKVTVARWNGTTWATNTTGSNHSNSTVTKIQAWGGDSVAIGQMIDSNGFAHFLAYADASDGVTASTVFTDFIDLEVELNVQTVPATGLATTEFKPYKLDYVLATPVEEALTSGGGAIALQSGGNQVELLEGVVWQEAATPVKGTGSSVSNLYYINILVGTTAGFEIPIGSQLKNRADKIIGVYRNGQLDSRWSIAKSTSAYGSERAEIKAADYDPTADYTVTYINLDKYLYTTNAIEAKLEYQTSLGSAVAANVQDIADIKNSLSIIMFAMIMSDIL
jgi:hypothetical protein